MRYALLLALLIAPSVAADGPSATYRDGFERGMKEWLVPRPADWEVAKESGNSFLRLKTAWGPALPRRPVQYALLRDRCFGDFTMNVRLRRAGKSLLIVFGYQDTLHFNYAHLSADRGTQVRVHNGIFQVNGGERARVDDPDRDPTLPDKEWQKVRIVRGGGRVRVFMNDSSKPALEAEEGLFEWGRVGLGSFNELGDFDDFEITGTTNSACNSVTMKVPVYADTLVRRDGDRLADVGQQAELELNAVTDIALFDFPAMRQWQGYEVKGADLVWHTPDGRSEAVEVTGLPFPFDESMSQAGPAPPASKHPIVRALTGPLPKSRGDNWVSLSVDPKLVSAMIEGTSYGLGISAPRGGTMHGRPRTLPAMRIHSKESKFQPYLELHLERKK